MDRCPIRKSCFVFTGLPCSVPFLRDRSRFFQTRQIALWTIFKKSHVCAEPTFGSPHKQTYKSSPRSAGKLFTGWKSATINVT
ncbi:hypothetical protein TRIP_B40020 [uncultured Desulfatiglans sp.]|uniref:Uncharacterized protein n=1 Tax=Uncultured Desulfatiglans sp. TaxID=1748965 RepID=A0A653ADD6_UNCDX|nr:hypothetical protein TRIP_B40020 [uncultured Desulfatiglans sp.]